MALTKEQAEFIEAKVEELGSVVKVSNFYNKDCKVDTYAFMHAVKLFGKKRRKK